VLKHAPNRENAILFLEYLASDEAQNYFANGNNEWPVVASVKPNNQVLSAFGKFRTDTLNLSAIGKNQPTAQKIADRSGFK
jgi:iron(III) transport system substrate-binding protein